MLFRPRTTGSSATRPVAALPFYRRRPGWQCVVESLAQMTLLGWASSAARAPVQLDLICDGSSVPATVRPLHRADVLVHLGASGNEAERLGYALELPPEIWEHRAADGSVKFHLRVDGDDTEMPAIVAGRPDLESWLAHLLTLEDGDEREPAWQRARPHLQRGLDGAAWQLALERYSAVDAQFKARAALPGARLKWAIEQAADMRIVGWAASPNGGDDLLRLSCGGKDIAAPVVRFERADVRALLGQAVRLDSGFEIEIPASVWAAIPPGEATTIALLMGDRPLLEAPVGLSREGVADWVARRRAQSADADWASHPDRRYEDMLMLEHVRAAEPALDDGAMAFLRELAVRHGVDPGSLGGAAPGTSGDSPDSTHLNRAIWALQRAFNDALASPEALADPAAAMQALLEARTSQDAVELQAQQRFVISMVPFFCARDALPALRPRLDAGELQTMAMSDARWELSLLLPVQLLDDLATLAERSLAIEHGGVSPLESSMLLFDRLAASPDRSWLNTAALLDALRRLDTLPAAARPDDADIDRITRASLRLLGSLGDDHASRLYDEHLIDACCHLAGLAADTDAALLAEAAAAIVRHLGLMPSLWHRVALRLPDRDRWPAALVRAELAFDTLSQAAAGAPTTSPTAAAADLPAALRELRGQGCADIDAVHRHALLKAAEQSADPGPWMEGLPRNDLLRWLGRRPEAATSLRPAERASGVAELLLETAPAPAGPNAAARARAWHARLALYASAASLPPEGDAEWRQALHEAVESAASLCGERHGFVGLAWMTEAAEHLRRRVAGQPAAVSSDEPMSTAWQALATQLALALHRAIAVCIRRRHLHPVPPAAALTTACWLLQCAGDLLPPTARAQLDATLDALREQWPGDDLGVVTPLPRQSPASPLPRLPAGIAGSSTLVLVRTSAAQEASSPAIQRIGATWARELPAAGMAWAVWQQRPGPTGGRAPSGAGERLWIHAPGLFELLEWLVDNSDFGQVLLLDDDAELAVGAWQTHSGAFAAHFHGLLAPPPGVPVGSAPDKSPADTRFASIANGLTLSRHAVLRALLLARSARGSRLARGSASDEKRLGDLLALANMPLSSAGHVVHQRREPRQGCTPQAYCNYFAPASGLPTVLTHDAHGLEAAARAGLLTPRRLWPADVLPAFGERGLPMQLVELSAPGRADSLAAASCIVVAVARNEHTLLPHFLAHYRGLGIEHFVLVDNLSDDDSRSYLLAQADVTLYSADTPYRLSRYGVAWQQAVLAAHGQGRWAVVADIDEFLVWPGCEHESLPALCRRLDESQAQAACVLMIDMYPAGPLASADFERMSPFEAAPCFDAEPVLRWRLGSGSYSNGPTWVNGLRHRLLPDSPPNHYTSQKIALLRHQPWARYSEGMHYAAGLRLAGTKLAFAHFKYHRGFRDKVTAEVARKQHYNDAQEYRMYQQLLSDASGGFHEPGRSRHYDGSQSLLPLLT